MRLYLDDDCVAKYLIQLLTKAGHDVLDPATIGLAGNDDGIHLRRAIRDKRVLVSKNYDDFEILHELVMEAGGHHSGIVVIRKDNDPKRNMTGRGIVGALAKLDAAGVPIEDEFIILNHWR